MRRSSSMRRNARKSRSERRKNAGYMMFPASESIATVHTTAAFVRKDSSESGSIVMPEFENADIATNAPKSPGRHGSVAVSAVGCPLVLAVEKAPYEHTLWAVDSERESDEAMTAKPPRSQTSWYTVMTRRSSRID
eukprot:scaffold58632_cov33-Tisochrysis_lutea.AAC.2